MGLLLPDNIPIAAVSLAALKHRGRCEKIPRFATRDAVVQFTGDPIDPVIVWASPKLRGYRGLWKAAHRMDTVDSLDSWGEGIDVDHVYPKSWARVKGMAMAYIRLFPVWAEVNRGAGAGREKSQLKDLRAMPKPLGDVVFADELQVLKIIGHPVGTADDPESIFLKKKRRRKI
jgi:hypothetical protein